MARVTVHLPSLLAPVIGGSRRLEIEAATVRGVLDGLMAAHPELRVHLFDESGDFRQHVVCFHNETMTRWMDSLEVPVADGDEVTIMQAVSGGGALASRAVYGW